MGVLTELDLDLAEEDLRQDPIVLPIKDLGSFEFPGTINALAKVRVLSWMGEGRSSVDQLSFDEALTLFRDLIPDETIRAMSNAGFDVLDESNVHRVEMIVDRLMAEYGRRELERQRSGGDVAATQTPPPYSGSGPSSSPTSSVSTTSFSPET